MHFFFFLYFSLDDGVHACRLVKEGADDGFLRLDFGLMSNSIAILKKLKIFGWILKKKIKTIVSLTFPAAAVESFLFFRFFQENF